MAFYKVTLVRSLIGTPHTTRSIVKSIGLGKRGSTVYRQVSPSMAGSLAKIKELISVEVTKSKLTKHQQRELRKTNPGFIVEKST
ncbi:Large ribosomal subunit protein uL30m [Nakaseomyces bracarensis]|uniref:Large ribosomal subunit protein uL30m n=1 Tax=Nakaseomyces bracarensis TaxID=273131 RepID=A0ABR4NLU0_9SACH